MEQDRAEERVYEPRPGHARPLRDPAPLSMRHIFWGVFLALVAWTVLAGTLCVLPLVALMSTGQV